MSSLEQEMFLQWGNKKRMSLEPQPTTRTTNTSHAANLICFSYTPLWLLLIKRLRLCFVKRIGILKALFVTLLVCVCLNCQVDGESLDRLMMSLNRDGNAVYMSVLFYASWCPFSRALRPKFDMLSSMFPQIQHFAVEHSQALPSVFSRYGIHSLPSILIANQTSKARYHGRKDLTSLIEFYEESTGLKPVQYMAEAEPTTSLDAIDGNLITWLRNGTSISEIFRRDPFLVLSLLFICLQMAILVSPIAESRMKALWASYVSSLNLERFGEIRQLFSRALHTIVETC